MIVAVQRAGAKPLDTVTDAEGRYSFDGLEAGPYAVWAGPEEYRSTHLRQQFGERKPSPLFGGTYRPNLDLTSNQARSGVDIALVRALAIEGRVSDPLGEPLAHVEVTVTDADGRFYPARPGYTDDLGAYRVYGLTPGRYRVCANVRDEADAAAAAGDRLVRTCHLAAVRDADAGDIQLTSADATGIDIRVQRIGSFSIHGVVLDAAGAAVDGARVTAQALEELNAAASATSRGGVFVLKGLTPGKYVLRASVGGTAPWDPNPATREAEVGFATVEIHAGDVGGVTVALVRPVTIGGSVAFEGGGAPPPRQLRMAVQAGAPEMRGWMSFEVPQPAPVGDDLKFQLKDLPRLPVLLRVIGIPDGWAVKSLRQGDRDITHTPSELAASPGTPVPRHRDPPHQAASQRAADVGAER